MTPPTSRSSLCRLLLATAVAVAALVALPPPASPQYVVCGSGETDKCGEKCVERGWFYCVKWEYLYRKSAADAEPVQP